MVIAGRNAQAWVSGILAIASGGFTGVLIAQSTPGNVEKFEVASIRPAIVGANRPGMQFTPGGGLRATNVTLNLLIQIAYDIPADRLSGGPRWADSAEYDVVAKGSEGGAPAASVAEEQQLIPKRLQALLADRFQLVIQREAKEVSGYELIVAKTAPLFTESKLSEKRGMRQSGVGIITAQATSMETFARFLSVHAGRPVVDKTGLTGLYDFSLRWAPDPERLPRGAPTLAGPSLFTALQEQLGLKLVAQKVGTDLFTITHAERPTEN